MPRLAYILASSHSGSTLLAMLLGAHPEARTVGELKATSLGDAATYRCSCRQPIGACGFWQDVSEAMRRRGVDFDVTRSGTSIHSISSSAGSRLLRPLHRGHMLESLRDAALWFVPGWRAHLAQTQARNQLLVETLQELTGAQIIVDSSKIALRLKYLLRNPHLDILVIRLIRDGRAVTLTYTDEWSFADASDPRLRGGGSGGESRNQKRSVAEAAREWRRSNEEAECVLAGMDRSRWMEMRYEEVCRDPQAALSWICGFLGLDPSKIVRDFRSVKQHVIGNGMRLDSSSEIKLDDRWRQHLTAQDLEVFEREAGDLNSRYGYA